MDLKEFVSETLVSIVDGIKDAQQKSHDLGASVNPGGLMRNTQSIIANSIWDNRNNNYHILLVPDDEDLPYHIIHNVHGVCGGNKYDNYPQALIIAEQFDQMLHDDLWKRQMIQSSPLGFGGDMH